MNSPFFRNCTKQQPSRSAHSVPVQQTPQRSSPKIISVPVHFVSSDQPRTTISMLKDSAALKIQKVFRGFAVRKSVKKIASIRNEVSEIETRIHDPEAVSLIRSDPRERLRVNETIMSLLFKLDSIRGVDSGVRDLRKSVTRKAIALQEKVDSISISQSNHQTLDSRHDDSAEEIEPDRQTLGSPNDDSAEIKHDHQTMDSPNNESVKIEPDHESNDGSVEIDVRHACTSRSEQVTEASNNLEAMEDEEQGVLKDYGKGNRDLLNQLTADNEKMMKLMMQISERNELQTRMINSLSRRVEQLEKVFIADILRKKKKTRVALRRIDNDSFCI